MKEEERWKACDLCGLNMPELDDKHRCDICVYAILQNKKKQPKITKWLGEKK